MNEENRGDEVNLVEFFNLLGRYKGLFLALPSASAVLAMVLVFFVLHPTWEASATLEIGQVAGQLNIKGEQLPVESPANVVSRIMLPSFGRGAFRESGIEIGQLEEAKRFYKTLKATQVKNSELVEIRLRGSSVEMANHLIQGAVVHLQKTHNEMMSVSMERNKKRLQIVANDMQTVGADIELIRKKLLATHEWNAFDATLSATLLKDKSVEFREMIQRKLMLEEQLTSSRSYTTRIVDEVYVSEEPVSPNKPLIVGLAILLGLLGAVVIAFVHNAIAKRIV